ncbi:NAD(P)H-quinone oxidoreductase subunit U, chloroplastic isoform X4 [Olea europaea var. sylvestris]|uniref:NAD(P)H-quinone oxidoreductase subunit U, chloroplastic isoform X4 n=1 Tax=Olea europaea var. sylvestris TaxID=158386 RepID=UPI000C1D3251|nr:NAD(P)H-quinone oxidoreductase subunit U, chloroplastic isoform X4 [Olea europaea var. sylvestris]
MNTINMLSSSTTVATACFGCHIVVPSKCYNIVSCPFPTYFAPTKPPRKTLICRSSAGDLSAESTTEAEQEWETPVEVPEGPPSLISALNVEKAIRGIAITDADHYGRLGLRRACSYDEVTVQYKNKVAEVMNKGLSEEELGKELELLRESHSILSSVEERRLYDWSLARNQKPDRYMWPFEVDITQTPKEIPPPPRTLGQPDWWDISCLAG